MRAAGYKLGGGAPAASQPIGVWDGSGSSASSTWAPAGEDESLESLQQRMAAHENAIEGSLGRTLKMARSTHEVGAETLRTLHVQSEQLKSIRTHQAKVETNLKTSDRLVRGMESWRGAATHWVAGMWSKEEAKATVQKRSDYASYFKESEPRAPAAGGLVRPPSAAGAGGTAGATASARAPAAADTLSQISSLVAGLRTQAETIHWELKAQSKELDVIHDKADSNASHLATTNARTKALRR
jgi:hypothetical protein